MKAESEDEETSSRIVIGVLALQGAFREHIQHIDRLDSFKTSKGRDIKAEGILVRNPVDLQRCSALIIPGGESTAIALGAQRAHLLEPLRDWVRDDRPTWGTCAGMIMLAREATGGKKSGQELIGGIDIRVGRNGYGSQVDSFEEQLDIPRLIRSDKRKGSPSLEESGTFPGIFIRAPIIESLLLPSDLLSVDTQEATMVARGEGQAHQGLNIHEQERPEIVDKIDILKRPQLSQQFSSYSSVTSTSSTSSVSAHLAVAPPSERKGQERKTRPPLEILSTLPFLPRGAKTSVGGSTDDPEEAKAIIGIRPEYDSTIVALKQGRIMCTSFHPELTSDTRLHDYFIKSCVLQLQ